MSNKKSHKYDSSGGISLSSIKAATKCSCLIFFGNQFSAKYFKVNIVPNE
jgi:hypothetical protein